MSEKEKINLYERMKKEAQRLAETQAKYEASIKFICEFLGC